jgi:hypothetical protein
MCLPASTVHPIHFEDHSPRDFERLVFAHLLRSQRWQSLEWGTALVHDHEHRCFGPLRLGGTRQLVLANFGIDAGRGVCRMTSGGACGATTAWPRIVRVIVTAQIERSRIVSRIWRCAPRSCRRDEKSAQDPDRARQRPRVRQYAVRTLPLPIETRLRPR